MIHEVEGALVHVSLSGMMSRAETVFSHCHNNNWRFIDLFLDFSSCDKKSHFEANILSPDISSCRP